MTYFTPPLPTLTNQAQGLADLRAPAALTRRHLAECAA